MIDPIWAGFLVMIGLFVLGGDVKSAAKTIADAIRDSERKP